MSLKSWLFIIPARLESTRLPKKPLQDLAGKPLIVRVAENLRPLVDDGAKILVATDSEEVLKIVQSHGFEAVMTSIDHSSGTDRCNEAQLLSNATDSREFVMNVQGDEPFVYLDDLRSLAQNFESSVDMKMGTLAYESSDREHFLDPAFIKVMIQKNQVASYFSRAAIPHARNQEDSWTGKFWEHVGVYAFSRSSIHEFCDLPQSNWEKIECLEQLRALENGWNIYVQPANTPSLGIDTPQDLEAARAKY
jgi:3-deoxy-manno-octulosonate cytidylyltransferase (CMP-KDO synthetase)